MALSSTLSTIVAAIDTSVDKVGRLAGLDIPVEFESSKALMAQRVVRRYMAVSFAGGLIPLPIVDMVAVSSAQLAMLAEITAIYENGTVPNKERLKLIASAVLGSVVPQGVAAGVAGSGIKALPVIGTFAGMILMPGLSSAVTYAIGKAFILHFEAGGTVDSIDPVKMGEMVAADIADPNTAEPTAEDTAAKAKPARASSKPAIA